jgi:hypothetical protein
LEVSSNGSGAVVTARLPAEEPSRVTKALSVTDTSSTAAA